MRIIILTVSLIIMSVAFAVAANWQLINIGSIGSRYFDESSVVVSNNIRKVWIKTIYTKEAAKRELKEMNAIRRQHGKPLWKTEPTITIARDEIDCKERAYRTVDLQFYDKNGKVLESIRGYESPYQSIIPDSHQEIVLRALCR